jgi:hypothetical protein
VKLVDMKSEPGSADGMAMALSPYPYGLRLNLSQEQLEALGYDELPPAGTEVRIEALGCVTRASSEDPDADGDIDYLCVEIQITEMGLEEEGESAGEDEDEDRAGRMYGKGKDSGD